MQLAYLRHRFDWGIAEGSEMNQQIPLNMNGDLMNGISFEKGLKKININNVRYRSLGSDNR